jgi:two-component system NarL family sensor kinase
MDLRAAPLQDHTLPEALTDLASDESFAENSPQESEPGPIVLYTYTPSSHFPSLPARIEVGLYRIAQEALTNARRHAEGTHISMTLAADDQQVRLVVQDDGRGFDPDTIMQSGGQGHFGLAGMHERVKLLGGCISIQSEPHRGTVVDVVIPYKA